MSASAGGRARWDRLVREDSLRLVSALGGVAVRLALRPPASATAAVGELEAAATAPHGELPWCFARVGLPPAWWAASRPAPSTTAGTYIQRGRLRHVPGRRSQPHQWRDVPLTIATSSVCPGLSVSYPPPQLSCFGSVSGNAHQHVAGLYMHELHAWDPRYRCQHLDATAMQLEAAPNQSWALRAACADKGAMLGRAPSQAKAGGPHSTAQRSAASRRRGSADLAGWNAAAAMHADGVARAGEVADVGEGKGPL